MSDWLPDLVRLQAHDDDEWLRVEKEYGGRLYHYVAKRVADREARADVLQETMLGAVRGIGGFDPIYTFEQYLFGICHNRTIDHLRRKKLETLQSSEPDDSPSPIERLSTNEETPSRLVRQADLSARAKVLLAELLREWVEETWSQGEFVRLMVIEALFRAGWRNKDTWRHFGLRDETAVAGIKFRALARLRELATQKPGAGDLFRSLAQSSEAGENALDFDVGEVWRSSRASCPARSWLARSLAGNLGEGPKAFLDFHLGPMDCEYCQANLADLRARTGEGEEVRAEARNSTLRYLRSRTVGD